jgi:hypothetical protein
MAIPKVSAITRFCFRMQQFQSPCWASLKLRNPWRLRDTSNSQGGQWWILNQIHQSIDGASPSCGERFTFLINQDRPWTNERAEDTSSGFREPLRAQLGAQDLGFGARGPVFDPRHTDHHTFCFVKRQDILRFIIMRNSYLLAAMSPSHHRFMHVRLAPTSTSPTTRNRHFDRQSTTNNPNK